MSISRYRDEGERHISMEFDATPRLFLGWPNTFTAVMTLESDFRHSLIVPPCLDGLTKSQFMTDVTGMTGFGLEAIIWLTCGVTW